MMIKYTVYLILTISAFFFVSQAEHGYVELAYITACATVILFYFRYINLISLAVILMTVKVLEYIVFENFFDLFNAYWLYFTYIVTDLIVMLLLYFRVPLLRGISERYRFKFDEGQWFITSTDLLLALVQFAHVIVGALMLMEHTLRNVFSVNSLIIYKNFGFLELLLAGTEFIVIVSGAKYYLKEQKAISKSYR